MTQKITNMTNRHSGGIEQARKIKVCLAASAGGHMTQLSSLSGAWAGYDIFYVTTGHSVVSSLPKDLRIYVVGECNRTQPFKTFRVFLRCIRVILSEKPDVVISTGAAAGCMLCLLAKLRGTRVVWMDSITNVERLSLSGQIVRPIADLFFVQWPHLVEKYRNVEYAGAVI